MADDALWSEIDYFLEDAVLEADGVLASALEASEASGLPNIAVSPLQGKLLWMLASAIGAKRILELGTLGGYSTIWMARALPADGKLISLEYDARHAEVARGNVAAAGLTDKVDIWIGAALDLLPKVAASGAGPFDFAFIDADKANIPEYFDEIVGMSRPGALIVVDNVVRHGGVIDAASEDPSVQGVRRFFEAMKSDSRVAVTATQTTGVKGHDGFAIAKVL